MQLTLTAEVDQTFSIQTSLIRPMHACYAVFNRDTLQDMKPKTLPQPDCSPGIALKDERFPDLLPDRPKMLATKLFFL